MTLPTSKITLADLSLPARLVVAVFLITVGLGYLSALVQLRVQHAADGRAMPNSEDVRRTFFGTEGQSQLERLITAPISLPFNGSGSMKGAFVDPAHTTGLEADLKRLLKKDSEAQKENPKFKPLTRAEASELVQRQREGERLAVLDWLHSGSPKAAYEDDSFVSSTDLADQLNLNKAEDDKPGEGKRTVASELGITEKYIEKNDDGKRTIKIRSIINIRCVRCHREGSGSAAAEIPLDSYADLMSFTKPVSSGGMSLPKLAQSTHVHLLGFAVLWCLTGLLFACTSYPAFIRAVFGPWTLLAQIADIACWWLAGSDPRFADAIMITGGLVGVGLAVQLVGTSLDLFRKGGRLLMILVLILVGVGAAGFYLKTVEPRLKNSHSMTSASGD
jgi:hypothetical protein